MTVEIFIDGHKILGKKRSSKKRTVLRRLCELEKYQHYRKGYLNTCNNSRFDMNNDMLPRTVFINSVKVNDEVLSRQIRCIISISRPQSQSRAKARNWLANRRLKLHGHTATPEKRLAKPQ